MPRGAPKKFTGLKIDPALLEEVKAVAAASGSNFSAAVSEGLRLWLASMRRKAGKADKLARHLVPPTARELAARKGD